MIGLSRRAVLGSGASGLALTATATTFVKAAAPPLGTQAPGWYRYRLGTTEVTVVTDGMNRFKFPDGFIVNQTRDGLNAALAGLYMEKDMMAVPYSPIAVNTGSKLIVIDTGWGEANLALSKGASGQFHRNLAASGIDRNMVDTVVISHFHADHINGLLMADNKPAFPNAEILVPAVEWKYFMDDGEMARQTTERMQDVFRNTRRVFDALGRKVTPYQPNKEVAPGIAATPTPGHTPGHTSYVISSGSKQVYVQSDVTNVPFLFARHPGWHVMFDQDAQMAEQTRRKVYDMLVAEKMLVQGFHYPFPALAHVEKAADGYHEIPIPWNPTI